MKHTGPYKASGFFLLRAPALPVRPMLDILGSFPAAAGDAEDGWRDDHAQALLKLWGMPGVSAAIRSATSDLADAVDRLDDLSPKDRHRAVLSLGRYLNRMSLRATPFGLVAGVAGGFFGRPGDRAHARLGDTAIGRARARADMGWVMHLAKRLAKDAGFAPELLVRHNDLLYAGRGRVWLQSADGYGTKENRAVSVRLNGPLLAVLEHTTMPRTLGDIRAHLVAGYPGVAAEKIDGLLRELLELDILVTAERPGMLAGSEGTQLRSLLPAIADPVMAQALDDVEDAIQAFNRNRDVHGDLRARIELRARAAAGDYEGQVLQIDSALGFASPPVLPQEVARLAEDAARVLSVVGSDQYPPPLREYADAFVERYGLGAEVPVLELLSEESGLGPPAGYLCPERSYPLAGEEADPPAWTEREALLVRMVSTALARRSIKVSLDDHLLAEFTDAAHLADDDRPRWPSIDVHLQLTPPGTGGEGWRGFVSGVGVTLGGRTFGRFHDLLAPEVQSALRDLAAAEEELIGDALTVELTYLPSDARAANVSIRPLLHEWELPVNVATDRPADRLIELADVFAGVDGGRLYLRSPRLDRRLHVTQRSMLNLGKAPNVCRFLVEISTAQARRVSPFEWERLAEATPFLPRIERAGLVLRRARWRLREDSIAREAGWGHADPLPPFADAVRAWRETWMVPRLVHMIQADNSILLDLTGAPSLAELRAAMARARAQGGDVLLEEALPDPDEGFLTDASGERYVSEVVVPLVRVDPGSAEKTAPRGSGTRRAPLTERVKPVGSDWLYVKLYAEPDAHDALVTDDLAAFAERLTGRYGVAEPFFIRYGDPAPHLRVRFHVPDEAVREKILGETAQWARALTTNGRVIEFTFAAYHREIDRYGGTDLIGHAERWFQRDSTAATLLLGHLRQAPPEDRVAMTALSLEHMGRMLLPSLDDRRRLARSAAPGHVGGAEYRDAGRALWADLTGGGAGAPALAKAEEIWRPAAAALTRRTDELGTGRTNIAGSLLHLHCNRMGLPRDKEEITFGVWRRLLDRIANTSNR
ncbi:lantibiotic dehydratase [Spirillospora sp. CA-128828]|uniref:lantibiotic dehydratase n=1 Tax=Spirillospora sp. CA-128828 TaxID=3240033 RepID=UPI003D90AE39